MSRDWQEVGDAGFVASAHRPFLPRHQMANGIFEESPSFFRESWIERAWPCGNREHPPQIGAGLDAKTACRHRKTGGEIQTR
jgi:hypothetical protein